MIISHLTLARRGGLLAPIAWMELSPGLHVLHGARSAEVIAIAVFAQPSALAGDLADLLAFRSRTIPLPVDSPGIRKKKPAAMTAFTPGLRAAHGEPNLRRIQESRKRKRRRRQSEVRRRKKNFQTEVVEENARQENGISNRLFSSTFIPPLTLP